MQLRDLGFPVTKVLVRVKLCTSVASGRGWQADGRYPSPQLHRGVCHLPGPREGKSPPGQSTGWGVLGKWGAAAISRGEGWNHVMLREGGPSPQPPPAQHELLSFSGCWYIPPSCRGTAQSLFRGSLLMLALAQRWFLWQLQRQMQERLQPRYRQPRYPRMFLPKYRQMATWHVRTDPTVTTPGVQWRLWANNTKNILQTLFPTSLPTFPPHCDAAGRLCSLPQQCAEGCPCSARISPSVCPALLPV